MPFGEGKCFYCKKILIFTIRRDITRKKYCSHGCRQKHQYSQGLFKNRIDKAIIAMNTLEANSKKSHKGKNHPKWINDRKKLKQKRMNAEEKWFFADILKDRNYTCQLSGQKGGKLSVHHLDSWDKNQSKRFDKNNVIVIKKEYHKLFHQTYGFGNNNINQFLLFREKILNDTF